MGLLARGRESWRELCLFYCSRSRPMSAPAFTQLASEHSGEVHAGSGTPPSSHTAARFRPSCGGLAPPPVDGLEVTGGTEGTTRDGREAAEGTVELGMAGEAGISSKAGG